MAGLTVQNFVNAGNGMAVAVAVIRGFVMPKGTMLGNFWGDLTRSALWIPLPLSILLALFLAAQGVPQTLLRAVAATGVERQEQGIARGAAAAKTATKQLGTIGEGFFSVNSTHPLENPTIASNRAQSLAILLIPVAFCFRFGRMAGDRRQGWAIFSAISVMFVAGLAMIHVEEATGNPALGLGANMERKEQRFGALLSKLWAASTTPTSNGSVNAMHNKFMPLSGLVMMVFMQIGEVIFRGVGAGLYPYAWAFFVPFILITTFAVLNLIVGLIVNSMQEAAAEDEAEKTQAFETRVLERLADIERNLDAKG